MKSEIRINEVVASAVCLYLHTDSIDEVDTTYYIPTNLGEVSSLYNRDRIICLDPFRDSNFLNML